MQIKRKWSLENSVVGCIWFNFCIYRPKVKPNPHAYNIEPLVLLLCMRKALNKLWKTKRSATREYEYIPMN